MNLRLLLIVVVLLGGGGGCGGTGQGSGDGAKNADAALTGKGTYEVSARLVEIPDGAIFKRDLYDYATVLKYEVVKVHRGDMPEGFIYVAHYDPWKPRSAAADKRVTEIGGSLTQFRAGDLHRMALELPLDEYFMGGVVNKYFGQADDPIYWAVWTDLER